MRQDRRLRTGILSSIGAVVVLVLGQGVALAAEGSTALDDPIGTLTDPVDDPIGTVTDVVDETIDPITDALDDATDEITDPVDDPMGAVTGTVDGTNGSIGGIVNDTVGPIVGGVENIAGGDGDPVDGSDDGATTAVAEPGTASSSETPMASRPYEGSLRTETSSNGPSDLDELARGGNDIVEGSSGAVCAGTARVVCLDLVGGLGALGLLFRAAEEAGKVISAFVDSLASTGIDLLGASAMFVMLTLTGIALISRQQQRDIPVARGARSPIRT